MQCKCGLIDLKKLFEKHMTFETCLVFMFYVDYRFNNNKHTFAVASIDKMTSGDDSSTIIVKQTDSLMLFDYNGCVVSIYIKLQHMINNIAKRL